MTPPRRPAEPKASTPARPPSPAREVAARRLPARDAALATELAYGTLRWQRYLDWILAPHSRSRLESLDPRVRVILRVTAYQIAFLERVPAFAAVNDAVTLAPRTPGVRAFVNAVLRSFARRDPREREPAPPRDPIDALATRCSFPTWLAERWVARYGREDAEALMRALNERPPLTLRTNTLRITRDALARRLETEEGLAWRTTPLAPEGLVVGPGGAPGEWRAFADGSCAVQDEASMLVARLLAPEPGSTVADVCAAPGTKTTHLAELMGDRGRVLAFDRDPARLTRVREAAARLGITIIDTRDGPVEALAPGFCTACDRVLVDATCSLEPEENEAIVRTFLAAHPDFATDPPDTFPLLLDVDGWLRCLPHRQGTDGFAAVRFRRS